MRTASATTALGRELPKATLADTLAVIADVALPTIAKGVILRRPSTVALAERLQLDRRAVRRMQALRDRYGTGPLLLPIPGRLQAIILDPEHVKRVLDESPEPFAAATVEKRAALSHFEPRGVLISHGPVRTDRRRFNEAVLDADRPVHRLAERFVQVVDEEMAALLGEARRAGELTWDDFVAAWLRMVRRVVLGDAARDDHALTDMLTALRSDANWAFLMPKRTRLRRHFFERLSRYLARAEPGSLASIVAQTPDTPPLDPPQQVPQWLFAFDAGAIATFRALALLASHPEQAALAREEIARHADAVRSDFPYLRASVLESVRLWPTTPMVMRETTRDMAWESGTMPARTSVMIFAPFFHRDDHRLAFADRFSPDVWLEGEAASDWPLIPFSRGPIVCPGRNLLLMLASTVLARLLATDTPQLRSPSRLSPNRPLPATLNHFSLRFGLSR